MDSVTEQSSVEALNSLKQCSICLENYINPKVLPCQHTYCYSCLVNIASGQSRITCPQCREEHTIPGSGVSGFRDSLVINQLLSITLPNSDYCADCKAEAVVSQCEHCQTCICTLCLVQHAEFCAEITTSLRHLKEELISSDFNERSQIKKSELQKRRDALQHEYDYQMAALEDQLKELKRTLERLSSLAMFVKSTIRIYDDMISLPTESLPDESYISSLIKKVDRCTTLKSLDKLKREVSDFETVARLLRKESDSFKFSLDIQNPNISVQYGKTVVIVKGAYHSNSLLERLNEVKSTEGKTFNVEKHEDEVPEDESGSGADVMNSNKAEEKAIQRLHTTDIECSDTGNAETARSDVHKSGQIHSEEASYQAQTPKEPRQADPRHRSGRHFKIYRSAAHVSGMSRATFPYRQTMVTTTDSEHQQNQLPRGVHSTIGQNESEIIGQSEYLFSKHKFIKPVACDYHVNTGGICVVDKDNSRILFCTTDGSQAKIFIEGLKNVKDVAISHDGCFVHLLFPRHVWLVEIGTAEYIGHLYKCSQGIFKDIRSVLCLENSKVVIVEAAYRCLIVFKNSREIRHFGQKYLKQPMSVAYNPASKNFYVTDLDASCVKIFTWEGRYVQTFAAQARDKDISGIAVDADDYVYVARVLSHRIDIYNPRRQWVRTITNDERLQHPLTSPGGLCLMPNGKLIVADTGNDRLQIL